MMQFSLTCPIDFLPLLKKENSFVCPNNHCFDCAKQGYVNLLPVQQKHSLHPGDNREMVAARARFLNAGFYADIAQCVLSESAAYFISRQAKSIAFADSACGEGYYTQYIYDGLRSVFPAVSGLGFDISKEAVKAAAKRSKNILWAVGSNHKIPLPAQAVDLLTSLFGFPVYDEFRRILSPQGLFVLVVAGQNHLIELRQKIYQTVRLKEPLLPEAESGFELFRLVRITQTMRLENKEQFEGLIQMTPHYYRVSADVYKALMANPPLSLTKDVICAFYKPIV